jgi:hypothetical protein
MRPPRESTRDTTRVALLAVVALATVHGGMQLWQLTQGMQYIVSHLTVDDTFYYLQTAWLTRDLGFVTFDGLHPMSGVQFAWFWSIYLLAFVAPSKSILLYLTLALCTLLNVACYAPIWRIGRVVGSTPLAQPAHGNAVSQRDRHTQRSPAG